MNVIYGAPCQIVAAGTDRNLVQAALPNRRREQRDPIDTLERVLTFGAPIVKDKKEEKESNEKQITQAGIPNCEQMQTLKRLLDFSRNL